MTVSKSNLNQCNEVVCIPADNFCDNQGSKLIVPVTLHNVCECDHLLVIVEVYNGGCLYSRQIKEVFIIDTNNNTNSCDTTSTKQFTPVSFCTNRDSSVCNSYTPNRNYYSGFACNSSSNNYGSKSCESNKNYCQTPSNNCNNKCSNTSSSCSASTSNKLISNFYVGEFEFFFLCEVSLENICVQVKTQVIYNC